MTERERVGFVGVGNQGGPIAMRILQGGHPLTVWARRPEALAEFTDAGATTAGSLQALASSCPLVAVCVTTDDDVRQVCLGADGLLTAMAPGSSLAVHSTVHPDTVTEVHDAGAARGVAVVDAPVSGGSFGARAGTMAVLLGGDATEVDRWRPVMATYATTVELLGGIGAGQVAKLINNALAAANLGNSLHALAAAEELGLDRDAAFRIMVGASGDNFMLRVAPQMVPDTAAFAGKRFRKDLSILQDLMGTTNTEAAALAAASDVALSHVEAIGRGPS